MEIVSLIQRTWPDWRVVEDLGSGAYGKVYRVERRDIIGQTQSAVKVVTIPKDTSELSGLRAQGLDGNSITSYLENQVRSLGEEIRLMETVKGYTNIVSIEDYHVIAQPEIPRWTILIRMELLTPLFKYISDKSLSDEEIIKLGIDICSALVVCRKKNIVHRDIKPENIFITQGGDFKLGDFGVARTMERMTTQFTRIGTYDYMAPEIYNNTVNEADIDTVAKLDIYSLGIVLYMLLNNGRIPFVPTGGIPDPTLKTEAVLSRMEGKPLPEPLYGSERLKRVVLRACSFEPARRYRNAEEMRRALLNLRDNQEENRAEAPGTRTEKVARRGASDAADKGFKKKIIAIVAFILLMAAILLYGILSSRSQPAPKATLPPSATGAPGTADDSETEDAPTDTPPETTATDAAETTATDAAETATGQAETFVVTSSTVAEGEQAAAWREEAGASATSQIYEFSDPVVEAAVREQLGSGDLYAADLATVTGLTIEDATVETLKDLSSFTHLTSLTLNNAQISDIGALSGLVSLKELSLNGGNRIGDIGALSGLINLKELYLFGNQISDISPLSGLTGLERLSLGSNRIADIGALSGLTNLKWLNLDGNQISDISPLSGLTKLEMLSLDDNQISDIAPLSALVNLDSLFLDGNRIANIGPLSTLTGLTWLCLGDNQITDIGALSGLTDLQCLFVYANQIVDYTPLNQLPKLEYVDVEEYANDFAAEQET